jgi:hypothetical protein
MPAANTIAPCHSQSPLECLCASGSKQVALEHQAKALQGKSLKGPAAGCNISSVKADVADWEAPAPVDVQRA